MATHADNASGSYRIEALKGAENYLAWRVQMADILVNQDLMKYADGTSTVPADAALAETWNTKDRKALTSIRLRVSSSMISHIMGATTSKDAWDTLKNVFNTQGPLAKILARRKLLRYAVEEGGTMEEEVRNMRKLKEELTLLGATVTDDEFSLTILTALPASWDPFISSMGSTIPSSSEIIGRILAEDARRKDRQEPTTALIAKSGRQPSRKPKFRTGVFCHGCGKEGHIKPECDEDPKPRHEKRAPPKKRASRTYNVEADEHSGEDSTEDYVFFAEAEEETESEVRTLVAQGETWLADSATQRHIVRDRSLFITYTEVSTPLRGVGTHTAIGRGDVRINFVSKVGHVPIILRNALHVPDMEYNLISLGRLTGAGLSYHSEGEYLLIKDLDRTIGKGRKTGHLYHMAVKRPVVHALAARTSRSWYEWHVALGHLNRQQLAQMHRDNLVDGMDVDTSSDIEFECDACTQAKHTVQPIPALATDRHRDIGDLVFSDIWGPARVESLQHNTYFISFTDAGSHYSMIYFMKSRAAALDRFKRFERLVETQLQRRIKMLNVDNAKEYTEGDFKAYTDSRGILCRTTAPYSPAQNGRAERLNRTLVERSRAMLIGRDLPRFLWEEAITYANYLRNRTPTRTLQGMTPFQAFWNARPDIHSLQEFGIPCWVLMPRSKQSKLEAKSEQFVFTGVNENGAGWRYYMPILRQILVSRNIIFPRRSEPVPAVTDVPPLRLEGESIPSPPSLPAVPSTSTAPAPVKSKPSPAATTAPEPRRSERANPRLDYQALHSTGSKRTIAAKPSGSHQGTSANLCFAAYDPNDGPTSLQEVMGREDWEHWKHAMEAEWTQLEDLGTFTLTELPVGRKAIGCRWVYIIKRDMQGAIDKYKARLVAQGFSQKPGQDFFETYAPVMRLESFRTLLALATKLDLDADGLDIKGTYLNSKLDEDIYMRQPPGYDDGTGRVLHLKKALYGLKQAGRAWNSKFNDVLVNTLGFTRADSDPCVYFTHSPRLMMLVIHVDDTAMFGARSDLDQFKIDLAAHFTITDLGILQSFVGLQIKRNRAARTCKLYQGRYLRIILERFGMQDCNPVATPLDPSVKLTALAAEDTHLMAQVPYAVAIGSLMYASTGSRPDISFAVQTLSQFTSRPSDVHWASVKHVMRYLKGTIDTGLIFRADADLGLIGYSDADWAQSLTDRRSVSGYVFKIAGNTVSWSSKKQPTVALSTMEAEYIAVTHATKEAIWLRALLFEIDNRTPQATPLLTDNQAAIAFAHDHQFHSRSKHIDIRHHFIRERIQGGDVTLSHCASADNCTDMLTKALARIIHARQLQLTGMSAR